VSILIEGCIQCPDVGALRLQSKKLLAVLTGMARCGSLDLGIKVTTHLSESCDLIQAP
jgi:hypothetical protein